MRALIFGCKGQLGKDLMTVFQQNGPTEGWDLPELDITVEKEVVRIVNRFKPDLVLNAAAYTDVESAEDHEAAAFRVNEAAAGLIARAAAAVGAPVVYYSTDYVFGGTKTRPYEPDDPVHPIGVYAKSKAAGEKVVMAAQPNHFIIRTAWLFGPGGNNFVEKILVAATKRSELKVVDDEVGSPTYTLDLAEATLALCNTTAFGIYHVSNAGACSRFEFARAILDLAALKTTIIPCKSSEFPTKAERPSYSVLSTELLEQQTGFIMRPWPSALAHYMSRR